MLELNFDITFWFRPRNSGKALGITLWRRREALCDIKDLYFYDLSLKHAQSSNTILCVLLRNPGSALCVIISAII